MDQNLTPERHNRFFKLCYPLLKGFAWLVMTVLGPFRSIGSYRVPRSGGVLILSNHRADVDPIAVQLATARPIHFMAKSELFTIPILGAFLRFFKAFPVNRGAPDRQSIKHAVRLLQMGETVCIFPEGQLSETGHLRPVLPGAALIVRMANVPVICCGITNTDRIMPYGKVWPRPSFKTVTVTWGEAHSFEPKTENDEILAWVDAELRSLTEDYERPIEFD